MKFRLHENRADLVVDQRNKTYYLVVDFGYPGIGIRQMRFGNDLLFVLEVLIG